MLSIDADERATPELAGEMRRAIGAPETLTAGFAFRSGA